MKQICRKCLRRISLNRSAHLRNEHGIDSRHKGAVAEHFAEPSEFGLTQIQLEQYKEGEVIKGNVSQ
jgi:hypothetical protein